MRERTFAIMGATGHIGRVIVEDLLKRGHTVRAIGRDIDKLHHLNVRGAKLVITEFDNIATLTQAFEGAYAVFTMLPPSYHEKNFMAHQNHVSQVIAQALENSNTKRVVNLSSIGANLSSGTGPIVALHKHEQRLNTLKNLTTLIHLRPDYFMENLNTFIPMILSEKVIRSPIDPNLLIPMVATRDIGWKAADFLDSTAVFPHLAFEFIGPNAVSMKSVTEVLASYLDIPELRYERISFDDTRKEFLKNKMSEELVNLLIETGQAFNSNKILSTRELSQSHRGATTIEAYIQNLTHKLHVHYA